MLKPFDDGVTGPVVGAGASALRLEMNRMSPARDPDGGGAAACGIVVVVVRGGRVVDVVDVDDVDVDVDGVDVDGVILLLGAGWA